MEALTAQPLSSLYLNLNGVPTAIYPLEGTVFAHEINRNEFHQWIAMAWQVSQKEVMVSDTRPRSEKKWQATAKKDGLEFSITLRLKHCDRSSSSNTPRMWKITECSPCTTAGSFSVFSDSSSALQ